MISETEFQAKMNQDGWVIFPSAINADMVERLKADIARVYEIQREIQKRNGVDYEGITQHMIKSLWGGSSFYDFLENLPLKEYASAYFNGLFVLNGFSGVINLPSQTSVYQHKMHRDMRTYFPVRLSMNMLFMLDDFTEENGATLIYSGSHLREEMPGEEEFLANAQKALGKAGDALLFNSNLVHKAGRNTTGKPRRCLGFTLVRPFMKQGFDYTSLIVDSDSDWLKQLLGYYSRIPKDLNEWYQPVEKRMYRMGQG